MSDPIEESNRISVQVSTLSTQLIESIDRQSELEKRLRDAQIIINKQKHVMHEFETLKQKNKELSDGQQSFEEKIRALSAQLEEEKSKRLAAEKEVDKLGQEVEDLTASLFDEANNMVSDARREKHDIEIQNSRLQETLKEKDTVLETLNLQLKNLKKVLQTVDSESSINANIRSPISTENSTTTSASGNKLTRRQSQLSISHNESPLFSPYVTTLRYDQSLYNEFLKFLAVLPSSSSLKATSTESKLLKRLVSDEIQPVLKIDNASGIGWLVRKSLLTSMMEGQVVVEPLSGINEAYQLGYETKEHVSQNEGEEMPHMFNFPLNSPPIAVRDPCAFCAEQRDDIIEHARMYVMKTFNKENDGSTTITNSFPLCHWCLMKVRQTCEIFAFLRSLKLGTWHLEKVTLNTISKGESLSKFSEVTKSTNGSTSNEEKKSNRKSFIPSLPKGSPKKSSPVVETHIDTTKAGQPTSNIQRAWAHLCKLRSMLHWAHVGIWNMEDSISLKMGPITDHPTHSQELLLPVLSESESLNMLEEYVPANDSESFNLKKTETSNTFDFEKSSNDAVDISSNQDINSQTKVAPDVNENLKGQPSTGEASTIEPVNINVDPATIGANVDAKKKNAISGNTLDTAKDTDNLSKGKMEAKMIEKDTTEDSKKTTKSSKRTSEIIDQLNDIGSDAKELFGTVEEFGKESQSDDKQSDKHLNSDETKNGDATMPNEDDMTLDAKEVMRGLNDDDADSSSLDNFDDSKEFQ